MLYQNMKMKTNLIFATLAFCLVACSGSKGDSSVSEIMINGNKMYVTTLNKINSKPITLPLSKLVEECTLVQLETNDDIMVGPYPVVTITDNYIGVRESGRPYMLFDRSGKYLRNIGSIGQGPGEYIRTLHDDIIDEKNGLIYLSPNFQDKILVYKISGEFVKSIHLPMIVFYAKIFLYDNTLTVIHIPDTNRGLSIAFQYDIHTDKMIVELASPSHLMLQADANSLTTRNLPTVFDFSYFLVSDTFYHFDVKNMRILPVFLMSDNTGDSRAKQYIQLFKDLILIRILVKDQHVIAADLKNKSSGFVHIVNDYYGNLPISVSVGKFRHGYFVHNIQPEQLMDDIAKRLAESSCTEKDRQALNKLFLTLEENTNNVIFIGKLKSEVKEKLW